ncbi:MAG TPA: TetR/AcrR family transcriptional regulator [Thermoleophilaceae bacterium]|jgi:AcrR family transcriptional regulator
MTHARRRSHDPARPKRLPREARERKMLEAATRVFSRRGYHQASMDEIAGRAHISKPMLYAYFDSKEGLCRACIRQARRRLYDAINDGVDAGAAPDEQLWLGISAFFAFVDEQNDSWAVLLGEATAGVGAFARDVADVRRDLADGIRPLLRAAVAAEGGDPPALEATQPLAHALIGAGQSLADWWLANPGLSRDGVARLLMNFAWMGFGDLVRGEVWEGEAPPAPRRTRG